MKPISSPPPGGEGDGGFLPLFDAIARADPERVFARDAAGALAFGALDRVARGVAAGLRARGVAPGERVATMLRNGRPALAMMLGLAKAGIVWVPVHVQQRGPGLRYVLEHSEPRLVIAEADLVPAIRASGAAVPDLLVAGEVETMLGAAGFDEAPPGPGAVFAILYTSGTTGAPKGVLLTHRMLRLAGEAVALVAAAQDGDVFLLWEPLYHIGGAQLIVLPLLRAATLSLVPRFSASRFWAEVRAAGASHVHYLGGILHILLKQPPSPLDRAHGARIAWGGGCPAEIWRGVEERFGVAVRECYGMTEAASITTFNDTGKLGSVGRPVPWFSVEIEDPAGRVLSAGERGEIVVRERGGGGLFAGYFRNDEATARALRGGALHTGDFGLLDAAGDLVFLGRMSDSVRCRGENVSAWEVERVAAAHPAVEECAMIGVAAEVGEQEIKLFLKPRPGAALDLAALSLWLGERLAPYQNPRFLALVDAFERTPSQRIVKHRLPTGVEGCWDRAKEK